MPAVLLCGPCRSALIFAFALAPVVAALSLSALSTAAEPRTDLLRFYVGTYTRGASQGIYVVSLDPSSGQLGEPELAAEIENPSFLALHPTKPLLYAVGELPSFAGKSGGAVSAFSIDRQSGKLTLLNQQSSGGGGPCHVSVDHTGQNVMVANYGGGSVACLPIRADGALAEASAVIQHTGSGSDPQRQKEPHAHSINPDPSNRFAVAADLGLDKLLVYRLNVATGALAPHEPPFATLAPGDGPRHLAFHPDGRHAYVVNELSSTVTQFDYDAQQGLLTPRGSVSTLPENFSGANTTAEILVHPSGRFVYASNRGHDSIALFRVDGATGRLTPAGQTPSGGKTPRNFGIDPAGQFLVTAHQDSGNLASFRIDPQTGALEATGHSVQVGMPVCVKFVR